ncbi:MAG: hypothetical protein AB7N71_14790 [Phycisphaerae bacterium]
MTELLTKPTAAQGARSATLQYVDELRALCRNALPSMFDPQEQLFIFCKRRVNDRVQVEGHSRRYTAITLLGLIEEDDDVCRAILHGGNAFDLCGRLLRDVETVENLGDVALTLWAANLLQHPDADRAVRRVQQLDPINAPHYVVELAWVLSALSRDPAASTEEPYRLAVANRLMSVFGASGHLFPHSVGSRVGLRGHVGCFADQVYPIQALSYYARAAENHRALEMARQTAARIVELMGKYGQWWWHYDARNGTVTEGYPVYSVHQNSMAPMALFDAHEAGGDDHFDAIELGLNWLKSTPELGGRTLVDPEQLVIWRKVARREPNKLTRKLQAGASRIHPSLRVPGVNTLFPPVAVDYECRPYHLGWVLFAWPQRRMDALRSMSAERGA